VALPEELLSSQKQFLDHAPKSPFDRGKLRSKTFLRQLEQFVSDYADG
jgi:hypothetical protein